MAYPAANNTVSQRILWFHSSHFQIFDFDFFECNADAAVVAANLFVKMHVDVVKIFTTFCFFLNSVYLKN
jgi:hypothetical protein